jgi:regulator of RNase E activity RraA
VYGDVVVGDDRGDVDAGLGGGQLGGHVEVHGVAGVVLRDVPQARATIDGVLGNRAVGQQRVLLEDPADGAVAGLP